MLERKEILVANSYHFYTTFLEIFLRYPAYLTLTKSPSSAAETIYLTELVLYPLNTAFRRLTCQHAQIPGMIPLRYSGLWHAVRVIASE